MDAWTLSFWSHELQDFTRRLDDDALFHFHQQPRSAFRSGLDFPGVEKPERDLALDQLVLQDAERRAHAVFGGRSDVDAVGGLLESRAGVFEVEALRELFLSLVQRVVDFRPIRLRNDVERGHLRLSIVAPKTSV
jgi:hypothetical protein